MEPPQYSYFNSADNLLINFIEQNDFDRSLMLNLLFQNKILLHEAYYFGSDYLISHIKESKENKSLKKFARNTSLFEEGSKAGLLLPACRNPDVENLNDVEGYLTYRYGGKKNFISPLLDEATKDRMFSSVKDIYHWPVKNNPNDTFFDVTKKFLIDNDPLKDIKPSHPKFKAIKQNMRKTEIWRKKFIEKAIVHNELSRSKLMELVLKDINANIKNFGVTMTALKSVEKEYERDVAETFLKLVSRCQHIGFGKSFSADVNMPAYDLNDDFNINLVIPSRELDDSKDINTDPEPFPYLDSLVNELKKNPVDIIKIREGEEGEIYLSNLRKWQKNPNPDTRSEVLKSYKIYCKAICEFYPNTILGVLKTVLTNPKYSTVFSAAGGTLVGGLTNSFLAGFAVKYVVSTVIREGGKAIYKFCEKRNFGGSKVELNMRHNDYLIN